MIEETLTTWYLEMRDRAELRPAASPGPDAVVSPTLERNGVRS